MEIKKHQNIFFDYNGTIVDDVNANIITMNIMLRSRGLREISSVWEYKNIFRFPIKEMYTDLGFDISDFKSLAEEYHKHFDSLVLDCPLMKGIRETISSLYQNHTLYILSISSADEIKKYLIKHGMFKYFKDIIGTSDIESGGKIEVANDYFSEFNIDRVSSILVGDTTHDYDTASSLGISSIILSSGHQSYERLFNHGCDNILDEVSCVLKLK